MNKVAFPHEAVVLLWHTAALHGEPDRKPRRLLAWCVLGRLWCMNEHETWPTPCVCMTNDATAVARNMLPVCRVKCSSPMLGCNTAGLITCGLPRPRIPYFEEYVRVLLPIAGVPAWHKLMPFQ